MPGSILKFDLNSIENKSLSQVISPTGISFQLPTTWEIDTNTLLLNENNLNNTENDVELVCFSDLSIKKLMSLCQYCEVSITTLNKINQRNNKTSYRFGIQLIDAVESREKLSNWCHKNNVEAAIIKNSPSLNIPGLLVMDMDSTTIEIECIDEIAALAGVGQQVAEVTELAMQGKLDFAQSLHQRVGTLANSSENILYDVAKDIPLMDGLETLVKILKEYNWRIAIASGGFTYFADHLKAMLSLDDAVANTLEIVDGKLTGKVLGRVIDANVKAETLLSLQQKYDISKTQTVAMGDGANDLVMMNAAHLGIAFHAKPIVQAKADSSIQFTGLDTMLHWLA